MISRSEIVGIEHPGLPDDLKAGAVMFFDGMAPDEIKSDFRRMERSAGRMVIEKLVRSNYGDGELEISGKENEKPVGRYNQQPLFVSITHTGQVAAGVISRKRNLGIDLERMNRSINPGLENRIIHPEEAGIIRSLPLIQVWTLKEAALKWYGTGLRLSMKRVRVTNREKERFSLLIKNACPVEVCSFYFKNHWVSIAYDP